GLPSSVSGRVRISNVPAGIRTGSAMMALDRLVIPMARVLLAGTPMRNMDRDACKLLIRVPLAPPASVRAVYARSSEDRVAPPDLAGNLAP
ncbi:MAG TPA: hypothetical protein VKX96_15530, partial [Chloroflexota bacterium]|nr:hypothetical protein [Chloroflexota bacterium]